MPKLNRPMEIRRLLCDDPLRVTDAQLLALLLATGGTRRATAGLPKKRWSAVELAEELHATAGGLVDLVRQVLGETIDPRHFGLGPLNGGRLVATAVLAQRWHRGFDGDGNRGVRFACLEDLSEQVFLRQVDDVTEGELIAVLCGRHLPDVVSVDHLFESFGGPRQLIEGLTSEHFEAFARTGLACFHKDLTARYRLLAGLELARRYRAQARLRPGLGASLGLESVDLIRLLDPRNPLERGLRRRLIEALRTHPDLKEDFARLDALARDAGVEDYERAVELHEMFEALLSCGEWAEPGEVLSARAPYRQLLAIARARIARATEPPARLLKVEALLERAQQAVAARPVAQFVEALVELGVCESGLEWALAEARDRFGEARPGRLDGSGTTAARSLGRNTA